MKTLIVPDLHGHFDSLAGFLMKAGAIDAAGNRLDGLRVIGLGDLVNGTLESINGDRACLLKAREWFDAICIGNHELPWLIGEEDAYFGGFHDDPHNGSTFRRLWREGLFVPAILENDILITHAGVHERWNFKSAKEAFDAINELWNTLYSQWRYQGEAFNMPKHWLFTGISSRRGGSFFKPGGIFWKDWHERANKNFKQIVGHTPVKKPQLHERKNGTFTLNLDCGGKLGRGLTGATIENGKIVEFISWEQ